MGYGNIDTYDCIDALREECANELCMASENIDDMDECLYSIGKAKGIIMAIQLLKEMPEAVEKCDVYDDREDDEW